MTILDIASKRYRHQARRLPARGFRGCSLPVLGILEHLLDEEVLVLVAMDQSKMETAKDRARISLAVLRKEHDFCDATLIAGEQTLPIHQAIVTQISPVFKKALCGAFKEDQEKSMTLSLTSVTEGS